MEEQDFKKPKKDVKKIYRSRNNKVISGVCGGLSEYFEVDVAIIRILFVLLAFVHGIGLLVYLIALLIIPLNPNSVSSGDTVRKNGNGNQTVVLIIGAVLILLGIFFLTDNLFYFRPPLFYSLPFRFDWDLFWPVLLILIGVLYLLHINQKGKPAPTSEQEPEPVVHHNGKRLTRSRIDRKISGVCGGLAAYFEIDSTIIRVLWVLLTLFIGALLLGIIAYIVMALFIPEGD